MKVKELIVELQKLEDQEAMVSIEDWQEQYASPHELEVIELDEYGVTLGVKEVS